MPFWMQLKPGDPYYEAWYEYREGTKLAHRGIWDLGMYFLALMVLGLVYESTDFPGRHIVAYILGAVGTAYLGRLLYRADAMSQQALYLPCPRCGQAFLKGPSGHSGFARRCVNCNLPKWAPRDPQETKGLLDE